MKTFLEQIRTLSLPDANVKVEELCGIVDCFSSEEEKEHFIYSCGESLECVNEDRVTYGDWQTPIDLAVKVCKEYLRCHGCPDVMIEPTCGLGAFILAGLEIFQGLSEIHAIEINSEYVFELKRTIISKSLSLDAVKYPKIYIYNQDVFKFDFDQLCHRVSQKDYKIALIGNPPWVTNSKQSQLNSKNIPVKDNSCNMRGIEAITGKSNYKQRDNPLRISDISQLGINAKKEFNVSVEASCFIARLNQSASVICEVSDLYTHKQGCDYGWVGDSFVAKVDEYRNFHQYDV